MRIGAILSMFFLAAGCVAAPIAQSPLTGKSYDIEISDSVRGKVITVKTHDEVRWINTTTSTVELSVRKPENASYSCRNGFSNEKIGDFVGSPNPYIVLIATLKSSDHASLCFSDTGIYEYNVRMIVESPREENTLTSGTVMVK